MKSYRVVDLNRSPKQIMDLIIDGLNESVGSGNVDEGFEGQMYCILLVPEPWAERFELAAEAAGLELIGSRDEIRD